MKYTSVQASQQRQLRVAGKLPHFLRQVSGGVVLKISDRFPEDAASLFEIDEWQGECRCVLNGFLYLWHLFFTLYNFVRSPTMPSPCYVPLSCPNDVLITDTKVWIHETAIFTCGICYPILPKIQAALA